MIRNNIERKEEEKEAERNYYIRFLPRAGKIPFNIDRNPKTMAAADRTPAGENDERLHLFRRQ